MTLFWGASAGTFMINSGINKIFIEGGGVQAFALIMAGVFVYLLDRHPEKTAQFGGAATFMVFLYTATFGATCTCLFGAPAGSLADR